MTEHLFARAGALTDLQSAKWLNPALGELLAQVKPHAGVTRAELTVPVAPSDALADTMVFEAPTNPETRFYLPRYRLATQETDQGSQYRVRLTRQDPGTRISVVVQPSMAPEVAAAAPQSTPLEHQLLGVLGFDLPGGAIRREWLLADRRDLPDGVELSTLLPSLDDRGELYQALTSGAANCTFLVRRTVTVAVPTGTQTAPPGRRPRFPIEVLRRRLPQLGGEVLQPQIVAWRRPPILLEQPPIDTPDPVELPTVALPVVELPAVGLTIDRLGGDRLSRLPVSEVLRRRVPDLRVPQDDPMVVVEPEPTPAPQPLFRATTRAVDQTIAPTPFAFAKEIHPYIYGDITGAGSQGGLVLEQLQFGGRHYSYYFAAGRPQQVFYLPDAFKLARAPEAPHPPMMSVAFDSSDGKPTTTRASVVFGAAAVAAPARLLEAKQQLAVRAGLSVEAMDLQPLLADDSRLSLRVSLPGSAGSSTVLDGARIDLRTALSAGFTVPLAAFQAMFDRLNGADPRLFEGEVEVRLDRPDRPAEKVPLIVNLADLAGPVVQITPTRQDSEPRYAVTFSKLIESPVRLDDVLAQLPQSSGPIACTLPASVIGAQVGGPNESLTAIVQPSRTPAEPDVLPDVRVLAATVTPDAAALWDAICDDTTSQLTREVTVKAPAQLFAPGPDGSQILAVVVEVGALTGGLTDTVELSSELLSAPAQINTPIADLVLKTTDAGKYRYRVSTVRPDKVTDGDWKFRSSEICWIVSTDVT